MCSLVTPQVWERVVTAIVLLWLPIGNVQAKLSVMITKLQHIQIIFSRSKSTASVPNFKYLCYTIPELLNVFEDPAQCILYYTWNTLGNISS